MGACFSLCLHSPLPSAQEKGACELKTSTKTSPHSEATVPAATHSVNITWLLKQLGGNGGAIDSPNFSIDRDKSTCATPRRNEDVTAALEHFNRVSDWGDDIASYLKHNLFNVPQLYYKKFSVDQRTDH